MREHYRPRCQRAAATARADFLQGVRAGTLTADALLRRYCTLVYAETGATWRRRAGWGSTGGPPGARWT